ncbi:uncharacterized protein LOC107042043 [Diachasma alloeum]|uniref:uncharacterized protein LOC107042043 n=1 Tax=Diachasma alloeum TaxID=454923 RepID=UPI0007381C44|nr:uncharacterized protein LOC107042043 [Diachasma alloeum]
MKPKDVTSRNEKYLLEHLYRKLKKNTKRATKFKISDKVRISKYKTIFEKVYTPNWATEIFTIRKVENTDTITYKLMDIGNGLVQGGFYQEELLKVKYPDVYLVEKVLKKRGKKEYVKWLGFDCTHNS